MVAEILDKYYVIIIITGLLSSIFTIITFAHWAIKTIKTLNYIGTFKIIALWWYKHIAFKKGGNVEKVKRYLIYVYINKLYSKKSIKQKIAIKEIGQLGNIQWAFQKLVERVGKKPKLSPENKDLILEEIINLCKKM